MEWSVGEMIGGAVVVFGVLAGLVAGVARVAAGWAIRAKEKAEEKRDAAIEKRLDTIAAELHEKVRKWETEIGGIKNAMTVKEEYAREGRDKLHGRIDDLDAKMQRDYARVDMMNDIKAWQRSLEDRMDRGFADIRKLITGMQAR